MKVSIIVPVYKVEKFICACLKSIIDQDYKDIELIIIDDCSPDNSITIAREFIEQHNYDALIISHSTNRGLSAARNSGIMAATGDAIYFIDSDDELYDKYVVSHLVQKMCSTDADIVAGNYQRVYDKNHRIISSRYSQEKIFTGNSEVIESYGNGDIPITAWNKLIKKEFITRYSLLFKEGILHEDELWTFNTVLAANSIVLTGRTTYNYYIQENSIMSEKNIHRLHSSIEIYKEMSLGYSRIEVKKQKISSQLNRFAFQIYLDIKHIRVPIQAKKDLYRTLRTHQLDIKTGKTFKEFVLHIHLVFPASLGYYIMSMTAKLYSLAKKII